MALGDRFARQLARPDGWAGRLLGSAMDIANRKAMHLSVDRLRPRNGERILDVGCGTGAALKEVSRRARCLLFGVDPSSTMLMAARSRLDEDVILAEASLGELPFSGGLFDGALALNMLYFCDAEGTMLADLHRVLRPGGRLVAYVTHEETMKNWSFVRAGRHRLYNHASLQQMLERGGFSAGSIELHEHDVGMGVRGLFAFAQRQG